MIAAAVLFSTLLGQLTARRRVGGFVAEPPVFSRVHHAMSDGMLGFMQARKVEDTPFPFPYAQLLATMLYAFSLLFPLVVAAKVGRPQPQSLSQRRGSMVAAAFV